MKKISTLFLSLLVCVSFALNAQTVNWKLDAAHSQVKFSVVHMLISEVEGNFKKFDSKITTTGDDFTSAKLEFTIDVNSINTENEMRDNHLKSDDFFNAEKFPKMTFKGLLLKKTGNNTYTLNGTLTIRDVTKNITLNVTQGAIVKDPYGNLRTGFKVTGKIKRMEYNLKWNSLLETGGSVVSDEVNLAVNLELIKEVK